MMKTPKDLPPNVQVWLDIQQDKLWARYYDPEGKISGRVGVIRREADHWLWEVRSSEATDGYGPLLYHCVMERLLGRFDYAMVCASRTGTSAAARAVWEYFRFRTHQIHIIQLPVALHVRSDSDYPEKHFEALNCAYRKVSSQYLDELRSLGKLVEEYNEREVYRVLSGTRREPRS